MSNEEHKQRILEGLGVVRADHGRPRVQHDPKVHDIIRESQQRHGHGKEASRAHLEEMLRRDDIPPFVRHRMQLAHNRHVRQERMEAHEAFMQQKSTT